MDGLEKDLQGRAEVLRLDLTSGVGREAARAYSIRAVPTTLVFDGGGQVVYRQVGGVDGGAIRSHVAALEMN